MTLEEFKNTDIYTELTKTPLRFRCIWKNVAEYDNGTVETKGATLVVFQSFYRSNLTRDLDLDEFLNAEPQAIIDIDLDYNHPTRQEHDRLIEVFVNS